MCAGVRVYCAFDVGLVLICGYLVVGLVMDVFRLMFRCWLDCVFTCWLRLLFWCLCWWLA